MVAYFISDFQIIYFPYKTMSIAPNDATMIDVAFLLVIYSPRKILAKISIKKAANISIFKILIELFKREKSSWKKQESKKN